MKSVAVIITTRERYAQFLRPMLESVASTNPFGDSWKVGIVAQGYTAKLEETLKSDCDRCLYNLDWDVWFVKDSLGPLDMRSTGLLRWDSDLCLALDDDFLFRPETNYDCKLWKSKCFEKGVGLVSGVHSLNETTHSRKVVDEKFKTKQFEEVKALTCTGGGMMFSREVALKLLEIPSGDCSCDNTAWSIKLYTDGYVHSKYFGSLCIHKAGSSGGLNKYLATERPVPYPQWIDWKLDTKRKYAQRAKVYEWPMFKHVKPEARLLHKKNREKLLFDAS